MNEPSLFTKIIRGDIPAYKIYEDEKTLAFLDIYAPAEGHTLVIPKVEIEFLWDLEEEDYIAVMETVKKVARHLREVMAVPYVSEKVVGTDVPHAHVHLVPFTSTNELFEDTVSEGEPDHEALAALAKKLAF